MDRILYKEKLKQARAQGGPVLIPASSFDKPDWAEVLDSINIAYNTKTHEDSAPSHPAETRHNSVMWEKEQLYFAHQLPYLFNYHEPVIEMLNNIFYDDYSHSGVPTSVKFNLVSNTPEDRIHKDETDVVYWHWLGQVKWGFNDINWQDNSIIMNGSDITEFIKTYDNDTFLAIVKTNDRTQILRYTREVLNQIGENKIKDFNQNIIYFPDIIFNPGDIVLVPNNCWHGYYSIGPRAGLVMKFPNKK